MWPDLATMTPDRRFPTAGSGRGVPDPTMGSGWEAPDPIDAFRSYSVAVVVVTVVSGVAGVEFQLERE
ncbi:Uncharacterized protein TCM_000772 [Theobroma cacao]|uniref:Uncharacterized protein n=1 Tax=Theobroma cacao TaxID=3641 RepID=A0A061DGY0_THECC|nr:Uncharacterized protein TCM_000772 [Theobroma cacao]